MNFIRGKLDGLWIIEPKVFDDNRGFFNGDMVQALDGGKGALLYGVTEITP